MFAGAYHVQVIRDNFSIKNKLNKVSRFSIPVSKLLQNWCQTKFVWTYVTLQCVIRFALARPFENRGL